MVILGMVICLGIVSMDWQLGEYFVYEDLLVVVISEMYVQGLQMGQVLCNMVLDFFNKKVYDNLDNVIKGYDKVVEVVCVVVMLVQQD